MFINSTSFGSWNVYNYYLTSNINKQHLASCYVLPSSHLMFYCLSGTSTCLVGQIDVSCGTSRCLVGQIGVWWDK